MRIFQDVCQSIVDIFAVLKVKQMNKIEHIGIAVKDLQASNLLFEKLFGAPAYKEEEVASEGVKTSFFQNGPNKIELLEATNPESAIAKFIEKKGLWCLIQCQRKVPTINGLLFYIQNLPMGF
jgi:hypothetical protein